jgi:large repetitive protein
MKRIVFIVPLLIGSWSSYAQSPTVSPALFNFSYLVGAPASKFPTGSLKATLPAASTSSTLCATPSYPKSSPGPWLTVTPTSGSSPLTMALSVNPTSLSPGTYSVTIQVTEAAAGSSCPGSGLETDVIVTLAVTNPPSSLVVTSPNFDPPVSGSTTESMTFNYTSGTAPDKYELYVSASSGIVPFSVTSVAGSKGAVWLRVANTAIPGQALAPGTSTNGVATNAGTVQIEVSLDTATLQTLDVGPYTGTVTIAATAPATGTYPITVTLQVSAGPPKLYWIFPTSMPAIPTTPVYTGPDPLITVSGNNFFKSSSNVFMTTNGGVPIPLATQWVSRQLLSVTLPATYLTAYPATLSFVVQNGAPPSNPSQGVASSAPCIFTVTDPSQPYVQSIVNAASDLSTAVQTGPLPNPVPTGFSSVSPREIISIFGQNLGPSSIVPATPLGSPLSYPYLIPPYNSTYVTFQAQPSSGAVEPILMAPLIMISANQINAIVPYEIAMDATGTPYPAGTPVMITVYNDFSTPFSFTTAVEVPADPGLFTFTGNGQGQAAVLNFDSATGVATTNSGKNAAPRGSAIEIYATGLGDIVTGPTITVTDTSPTPLTASMTYPLTVNSPLTISPSTLPTGEATVPYTLPSALPLVLTVTPDPAAAAPVVPPYLWSVTGPNWLTLTPDVSPSATATLTGTPAAPGTFIVTVTVTDSNGTPLSATMAYALTIAPGLTINTPGLPAATVGTPFSWPLSTLGATGTVNWSPQTPPGLPGWLNLAPDTGLLSGTPSTLDVGMVPISFQVIDSGTPQQTALATYILTVIPVISITPSPLPLGVINQVYAGAPAGITLTANGATCAAGCTWADATLPAGMRLTGVAGTLTATLSGKPTAAGTSTIRVTDDNGQTATVALTINPTGLTITTPSLTSPVVGLSGYTQALTAQGGSGTYTWSATGLPPGLGLSTAGVLSGNQTTALQFPLPDGIVAPPFPIYLNDDTYRVVISGQSADTFYAGVSPYSAAGLTQINAIVPLNVPPGTAVPITVEIGPMVNGNATARRSQPGATIGVK